MILLVIWALFLDLAGLAHTLTVTQNWLGGSADLGWALSCVQGVS